MDRVTRAENALPEGALAVPQALSLALDRESRAGALVPGQNRGAFRPVRESQGSG
jgi:hypothetical protein